MVPGEQWMQAMFSQYAGDFIEICDSRPIPATFGSFIERQSGAGRTYCLDLACGPGRFLPVLRGLFDNVVGLDASVELLDVARERIKPLDSIEVVYGDMRAFPGSVLDRSFDLIIRPYTSLGYFPRSVEATIIEQCRRAAGDNAVLIYDSFNFDWFRHSGRLERRTPMKSFDLLEEYHVDETGEHVACTWTYARPQGDHTIEFVLEGYTVESGTELFAAGGWPNVSVFSNFDNDCIVTPESVPERLVFVARRS